METPRKLYVSAAAYFALVALILAGLIGLALFEADNRAEERYDSRLAICREIETLKADSRRDAWRSFNDLNKNLRLLKIPKTTEIVEAARASRDAKLNRFKANDCESFAAGHAL